MFDIITKVGNSVTVTYLTSTLIITCIKDVHFEPYKFRIKTSTDNQNETRVHHEMFENKVIGAFEGLELDYNTREF